MSHDLTNHVYPGSPWYDFLFETYRAISESGEDSYFPAMGFFWQAEPNGEDFTFKKTEPPAPKPKPKGKKKKKGKKTVYNTEVNIIMSEPETHVDNIGPLTEPEPFSNPLADLPLKTVYDHDRFPSVSEGAADYERFNEKSLAQTITDELNNLSFPELKDGPPIPGIPPLKD